MRYFSGCVPTRWTHACLCVCASIVHKWNVLLNEGYRLGQRRIAYWLAGLGLGCGCGLVWGVGGHVLHTYFSLFVNFYWGHFRMTFCWKGKIENVVSKDKKSHEGATGWRWDQRTEGKEKEKKGLTNRCTFTSVLSMPCTAGVHDYTLLHNHTFVFHLTKIKKWWAAKKRTRVLPLSLSPVIIMEQGHVCVHVYPQKDGIWTTNKRERSRAEKIEKRLKGHIAFLQTHWPV